MGSPCADTGAEVAPSLADTCWVPQLVAPGLYPQCCGCALALASAPEPSWPRVTAAIVPNTVGALTLEGKFGSIQELREQTQILLPYTQSAMTPINAQIPHLCGSFAGGWELITNLFLFSAPQDSSFPPVFSTFTFIQQRFEQAMVAFSQVRASSGCTDV